ncbi:MAG: alpha/beta hydrolase [Ilumatobacter sp.]|nr:alpha/beta hydrolase [Ilumatobacter sp.]
MPSAALESGVELEYNTFGDPGNPTLLLVNGYTSQMIVWEQELLGGLVAQGLHVVIYDNRDVGLSTKFDGQLVDPMLVLQSLRAGEQVDVPYTLSDMAADGIDLLGHLGIDRAHIAGVSMGGMIVQMMAIEHPTRVISLTSIMSSPSDPKVGRPSAKALKALLAPPPTERNAYIEQATHARVWLSKKYYSEEGTKNRSARQFDRLFYPEGFTRQLAAIYATGDRSNRLRGLNVPTLVMHGRDDELITPSGGERTAELIAGANYLLVSNMGHDLPVQLTPVFAEAIGGHIRTATHSTQNH